LRGGGFSGDAAEPKCPAPAMASGLALATKLDRRRALWPAPFITPPLTQPKRRTRLQIQLKRDQEEMQHKLCTGERVKRGNQLKLSISSGLKL
jgi:hypothetical protein